MDSDNTEPMKQPARLPAASALTVAGSNPSLPTRAFYKWLASELILNKALWHEFYDRCKAMASANLYGHKNPNSVAGAVLKGYSLGMDFMESLSKIKVIKGNPVLRGPNAIAHIHAVVAGAKCRPMTDVLRSDERDQGEIAGFPGLDRGDLAARLQIEHADCWAGGRMDTTKIAVWIMVRPDWEPAVYTFTMAQAELAGLPDRNENWKLYPDRCLKWQAASVGTQEMFGDELAGMYLAEELENAPGRVIDVAAADAGTVAPPPDAPDVPELPEGMTPEAYNAALAAVGSRLRALDLSYAFACEAALGEQLGDARPDPAQLETLAAWLDTLEQTLEQLRTGGSVGGYQLKVYRTEYDRHRPVVEIMVPGSGRGVAWTGASRNDADRAKQEGARAALMALLGQPAPAAGEDDDPDPAVVEAAHAALEAEKVRIAGQEGVTARGSTGADLEAAHKAARAKADDKKEPEGEASK